VWLVVEYRNFQVAVRISLPVICKQPRASCTSRCRANPQQIEASGVCVLLFPCRRLTCEAVCLRSGGSVMKTAQSSSGASPNSQTSPEG